MAEVLTGRKAPPRFGSAVRQQKPLKSSLGIPSIEYVQPREVQVDHERRSFQPNQRSQKLHESGRNLGADAAFTSSVTMQAIQRVKDSTLKNQKGLLVTSKTSNTMKIMESNKPSKPRKVGHKKDKKGRKSQSSSSMSSLSSVGKRKSQSDRSHSSSSKSRKRA